MAIKVDLASKRAWASVQDLLPESPHWGWPGEGRVRLSVGSELHRLVQQRLARENTGYVPEVPLDREVRLQDWRLAISGRCDGVFYQSEGKPIVEEIKTLHFRTDLFHPNAEEAKKRFAWQVRLYAFCLFPEGEAKARLRLVDLAGEGEQLQEVAWSPEQVEAYLRGKLSFFIQLAQQRQVLLARWQQAAERLPFPFPEVRPVQEEAMKAVEASLASGRHLLLAAPTGVGKTAAALYPALKHALQTGKRLVFATAKTLQQKLAVETLAAMNDGSWRSAQVRAKAKMCANREVVCHEEFCPFIQHFGAKLAASNIRERLLFNSHLEPSQVFAWAREEELCPFGVQLELLPECLAVVCDYNYVFDPGISLFGKPGEGRLGDTFLVVDEAHNLVDRAREYFSPRLCRELLRQAWEIPQAYPNKLCRQLTEVLQELEKTVATAVTEVLKEKPGLAPVDLPLPALRQARLALDALMVPYFAFKRQQELWLPADPVVEVLLSVARLVDLAESGSPTLVALADRAPSPKAPGGLEESLRLYCLDPSPFLQPVLDECAGCVAMSATLQPFEFYQNLLGFDPDRTDTLSLPSPFPKENRLIAVVDHVDTSYRHRNRAYAPIAELIPEILPQGKNALVLVPSYAFLKELASRLSVATHQVLVQQSDDSDANREALLSSLQNSHQPVLLMGVLGGAFAEGVDYPGEMLSEVIIVSPGLPQVNQERELLKAYFDEKLGKGFAYAYLIPGMTRVIQAAGRLIRSPEDRGVIVLVCRRFLQQPYLFLLPEEWTEGDPGKLRIPALPQAIRRFFAEQSRPATKAENLC